MMGSATSKIDQDRYLNQYPLCGVQDYHEWPPTESYYKQEILAKTTMEKLAPFSAIFFSGVSGKCKKQAFFSQH